VVEQKLEGVAHVDGSYLVRRRDDAPQQDGMEVVSGECEESHEKHWRRCFSERNLRVRDVSGTAATIMQGFEHAPLSLG
jgi:hypothetical protein